MTKRPIHPASDDVQMIAIDQINIINPRLRDRKKHQQIVESIATIGLKKPITVSRRIEARGEGYDLVCGQGRLEAFQALGAKEIPALVVAVSREDRLLMSLVENMARRHPSPSALLKEIQRLHALGYSNVKIGKKLGVTDMVVGGYLALAKAGEERLLQAALAGTLPITIAIEIARADTPEAQREFLKAYESQRLPSQASIRIVKRLMEQRRLLGPSAARATGAGRTRASADSMVLAYKQDAQRRKKLVQKATLTETRLVFVVNALKHLLADDNFVNLLKAESLSTMPEYLASKIKLSSAHASAA